MKTNNDRGIMFVCVCVGGGYLYTGPFVMGRCGPCQRFSQPEQTVANQLQQGAGMRSVYSPTGW